MNSSCPVWPPDRNTFGIYVHVPFCKTRCHYCDFVTGPYVPEQEGEYIRLVIKEMDLWHRKRTDALNRGNVVVDSIYLGGGTPSLLSPDRVAEIIYNCSKYFAVQDSVEITIEANPATLNHRSLKYLREAGVNRVSLGIQSLDDDELIRIGRGHSSQDALSAFEDIREAGFDNISIDLLAGIPGQSLQSFQMTLRKVLEMRPEHLSVYLFELKKGTRIASLVDQGHEAPPNDDLAANIYKQLCHSVQRAGYVHYEISNFCLPSRHCRHNLKYWSDDLYFGFGPGAHGMMGRYRYANYDDAQAYVQALDANLLPVGTLTELSPMTRFKDALIMGSRLVSGLNLACLGKRYAIDALAFVNQTIGDLNQARLFNLDGEILILTLKGRLLSNQIFSRWV